MSKQRANKPAPALSPVPGAVDLLPVALGEPGDVLGVAEGDPASPVPGAVDHVAPGPTWQDLKAAAEMGALVEVRLIEGNEPQLRGGLVLYRAARRYALAAVAEAGESHLRALASDHDIEARIVWPEPG